MVLEDASSQDKRILAGAFVVAIAVSAVIGFASASISDSGSEMSSFELIDRVESVIHGGRTSDARTVDRMVGLLDAHVDVDAVI